MNDFNHSNAIFFLQILTITKHSPSLHGRKNKRKTTEQSRVEDEGSVDDFYRVLEMVT